MTTKQISKNQSENKSLNCFCYTQNIFHKSIIATVVIVNFDTYESLFLSVEYSSPGLLFICEVYSICTKVQFAQAWSKKKEDTALSFQQRPNMKDTIFNYVQLDLLWEKFWPCPTPRYLSRRQQPNFGDSREPKRGSRGYNG